MARLNALFTTKESCIELTRWERIITAMDIFNKVVIIIIKPVKHEGGELLILQRLAN